MNPAPLVSVLIRTIGRASLTRSVAAALAQTHRPLEIVIVSAGAPDFPALPAADGVDIRIVDEGPCNRPRAANIALAHGEGEWQVFLDDDDAFAPEHVALLLDAARRNAAGVAYSATACVDAGNRVDLILGAPFNRLHLLQGNYIQIGAALFNRAIAEPLRFDESLECLQDWDFWIQLAQRTHFAYTGLATNLWSAFTGASGAGMGANQRADVTAPYRERVAAKWAAYADLLHAKVRHHNDAARSAQARGNAPSAQRHFDAAIAISSGPIARRRSRSRPVSAAAAASAL